MNNLPLFQAIMIETLSACNRRCWFCMYGQQKHTNGNTETVRMPWSLIERLLANLKELNYRGRISWYRINEPLLDERIFDILRHTKRYIPNCHQTLTSNGDFLDQSKVDRLLECGLDHLAISIYDDRASEKAARLRISERVTIKERPAGYQWENRGGNIAQLSSLKTEGNCHRPSTGMNIIASGEVVLCCADFYGQVRMGNVGEKKLEEIWFGEPFQRYRQKLVLTRAGLALCSNCSHDGRGHGVYGNPLSVPPASTVF